MRLLGPLGVCLLCFAATAVGQTADPHSARPDDKIVRMDRELAARLVRMWGWEYKGGWGMSGATWVCPAEIDGFLVFVKGSHPGHPVPERFFLSIQSEVPKGQNPEKYLALAAKKIAPIELGRFSRDHFYMSQEIDLSKGMPLSEVRARMLKFARAVKPYAMR